MATANQVREAHKLLDSLFDNSELSHAQIDLIRGLVPELPKQKTLEEITELVNEAWGFTHVNEWDDDAYGSLESWLSDLETQLQGVKETSANVPELPAGMRIAVHAVYGRVVTSPKPDQDGVYVLLLPRPKFETGADWEYAHECELTFIDAEPAKPAHPEFLETGAEYEEAPQGTIVAKGSVSIAWIKKNNGWLNTDGSGRTDGQALWGVPRKVLRWGEGA